MRIAFPLFDGFTALDLVGPYEILRMLPGAEIVLAGERAGQAVPDGVGGLSLVATHARAEVCAADVLLVPGGPGARRDVDDPALLEWITAVHATTRWTASVCTGALLLGAAGLLTGKSATTHWSAVRELESYGATYTPERVVTHPGDRLIIGAGVSAGIDLAITLAAELTSPAHAQAYQLGLEYDPRPPYDAGSLAAAPAEAKALLGVGEEDPGA
ncbi:DJ-1/PfpI family protein [Streptomyces sp. CHA1]|uniref:DJ-1/PfpI family protein n=1 Tax=unclassified Streptomyces TaxID=2593676 RepID=UPI001BFC62CD|nr:MULTISPECIES: DJ-1/PfpI family protein [unclassified Streptomyces]MBT3161210.1 DJ-1/PfpI family protein [Streptomyces sp. G11C]MCO6699772.1 DJ-1/PfpI family protein [Streptomyces sp. CHB9.2]MCO6708954.1 DJ-1/PfpI family protein [Streptomyces sp. CHA3]MCO6714804.1 DJ-1/PfpI family protein [Streptomyces sp. CHB19.2]MCO6720926.1 DJ-1/PfpI family protein [Streptomyces sp. Vc714c-19]